MTGLTDRGSKHATEGSLPLQPDDFSFHGFGELRRDELRKILRLGIRNDEPKVVSVEEAIFVPGKFDRDSGQPKFAAGIATPDGQPIETAQMHRKGGKRIGGIGKPIAIVPEGEVDEDVVYLGMLFNHYGRVLLESLSRAWYLTHVDPSVKVVFSNANSAQAGHARWLPRILDAFGIPPERILALDQPTRLRRAIVPEPLFEQYFSAHPEMVRPFRDIAHRVAGDVKASEQPVYLSRRLLSSRQRPIVGEDQLERLLRENGFRIAHPETMTIEDQVRMMNTHGDIFSSLGSAAHNVLFSTHRPRLHLLANRDDVPANYYLCSALADAPTTFINCLGSGGRASSSDERTARRERTVAGGERRSADPDAGPQALPQLLDMEAIVEYLDQRGFLKHQPPASLSGASNALQDTYDEAWFYARVRKASSKPESFPPDLETEAITVASHSWPVCLMLARAYFRARDEARTETMVRQFIELVEKEPELDRLAYFRGDVENIALKFIRLCSPDTSERLANTLAERFDINTNIGGPIPSLRQSSALNDDA